MNHLLNAGRPIAVALEPRVRWTPSAPSPNIEEFKFDEHRTMSEQAVLEALEAPQECILMPTRELVRKHVSGISPDLIRGLYKGFLAGVGKEPRTYIAPPNSPADLVEVNIALLHEELEANE